MSTSQGNSKRRSLGLKLSLDASIKQPNYGTVPLLLAFLATINAATHYAPIPFLAVVIASACSLPAAVMLAAVAHRRRRGGLTSAISLVAATISYASHGEVAIAASAGALVLIYMLGEALYRVALQTDEQAG